MGLIIITSRNCVDSSSKLDDLSFNLQSTLSEIFNPIFGFKTTTESRDPLESNVKEG